MFKLYKDL